MIENTVEILLVGDCLKDRTTYSRYLLQDQQYTYSILEADTGKKGLQLCYQKFPDVIVMDDLLPDIDVVEFLTSLKTQLSKTNLPIIILTSLGNEQIALQAMNSGAAYCLVKKTITPVCFIQAIQKVLEKTDLTQKLQESEERFQATFNQTSVGIAHVGLNGRCLRVNQKLCEILGYKQLEAAYNQLERRVEERTSELSQANMRLQQEIAKHKQSEAQVAFQASLLDQVRNAVIATDLEGKITYWNQFAQQLYHFTPEDIGKFILDVIIPTDQQETTKQIMPSIQATGVWAGELELQRRDGSVFPAYAVNTLVRDQNGNPCGIVGVSTDITERKQAQEKIKEQAALLNVASDAIFVRNLEHEILFWNQAAESLYGWKTTEVLGKKATELFSEEFVAQVDEALNVAVQQGKWEGELLHTTKDGKKVVVFSRWTLLRDNTGQPKSILTVNTDITEKKQLEAQFYRIQRLESLGTLASGIAHDLNNMLSPILAVAQLLPLKLPNLDEKNQELLKILEDSSKRGAQLVKQITSFAQGAEGKLIPLQLKNLILEVEGIVNSTFPKSIEIFTSLGEDLWTVSVDQTQIHQVLMNLCVNARDAMPQGGILSIRAENFLVDHNYARMNLEAKEGPYVVITVSDTGYGISKEVVERIFEPFFTTKEQGKGTGLGLATVLGIIKNHGGFVRVHSEVGEGSEFRVYLPAIEDEVATQEEAENYQIDRGNNELILVVDDEAFIREMTKNSLEQYNYRVLTASDAVDAFSLYTLHKDEISVVLIDIQMPTIDGLNAIRILQQIDSSIKIIVISGLASNRKLLEASGIQVQAFLLKPYTIKDLLNTIQAKL